jgi:hypothetical protein
MINEEIFDQAENYFTEGFVVTQPDPLSISVGAGTFFKEKVERVTNTVIVDGEEIEVPSINRYFEGQEYPAFDLQLEGDEEVPVVYDIYLLRLPSNSGKVYQIDRTELSDDNIPMYTGEDTIEYCLIHIIIPPAATEAQVEVRHVRLRADG